MAIRFLLKNDSANDPESIGDCPMHDGDGYSVFAGHPESLSRWAIVRADRFLVRRKIKGRTIRNDCGSISNSLLISGVYRQAARPDFEKCKAASPAGLIFGTHIALAVRP
ncbi:MAG: hypothetical protein HPY65_00850 [Syntrophaceae bacterium]|nr:hypothetical protein [Syntrophaceae bacterium]